VTRFGPHGKFNARQLESDADQADFVQDASIFVGNASTEREKLKTQAESMGLTGRALTSGSAVLQARLCLEKRSSQPSGVTGEADDAEKSDCTLFGKRKNPEKMIADFIDDDALQSSWPGPEEDYQPPSLEELESSEEEEEEEEEGDKVVARPPELACRARPKRIRRKPDRYVDKPSESENASSDSTLVNSQETE
jgi:hypothetical protein